MNIRSRVTQGTPTCNDRFARARTLEIGRRLIDAINRIRIATFAKCGCGGQAGYTLTDPFPTPSVPRNPYIVSRTEPRRPGDPGRRFPQGRKDRFLPFSDNPDIFRHLGDVPRSRLCEGRNAVLGTTASHARKVSFHL